MTARILSVSYGCQVNRSLVPGTDSNGPPAGNRESGMSKKGKVVSTGGSRKAGGKLNED